MFFRSGLAHDDTSMPEDRTLQGSDEPGPQMLELATIQPSGSAANQFNLEAGSEEEDASPSAAAAAHAIAHFRQTDPGSQQLPEQSNSASRIGDNQASGVQL